VNQCWVGLGSNLGDREDYLKQGIRSLNLAEGVRVLKVSSIYETAPYGPVDQAPFLNMVVEIETKLSPEKLLGVTQDIEKKNKRERLVHWGPRTLDLDILLYADKIIRMENLIIPHPEMARRLFVLVPLKEIARELVVPGLDANIKELYERFNDYKGVQLWKQNNGVGEFGLFES
jgi:2-amino-4-hydroxy-6-hydroxymethyldihydropteridine diphosphokinase